MRAFWLLALAACASPPTEHALVWASPTFFGPDRNFGGFHTSWLADADAGVLLVQPAWADGQPEAYVITEIWQAHPDVWVQPVYGISTQGRTVFGVRTDSTFYSPFWRQWLLTGVPGEEYKNVASVTKLPRKRGPLIVCPIVPDGVGLSSTTHPFFPGVKLQEEKKGQAFVDGVEVDYLDLGADRQIANAYEGEVDGTVTPADFYVFVRTGADGGREIQHDIPVVLPEGARQHAYVRRVDVLLEAEQVFVPSAHPAITGPDADLYRGRVARYVDGGCFDDSATFPGSCEWLDSEEEIEDGVPAHRIIETNVTLTATPLVAVP